VVSFIAGDHCNSEQFAPRCYHANEIVVVTAATFGILDKTSRCVAGIDPENTEVCSANVFEVLSGECSGRKYCSVQVSTLNRSAGHCPASLASKFYLNVSYECVKGL
jgi:Galactose binding lectin domain